MVEGGWRSISAIFCTNFGLFSRPFASADGELAHVFRCTHTNRGEPDVSKGNHPTPRRRQGRIARGPPYGVSCHWRRHKAHLHVRMDDPSRLLHWAARASRQEETFYLLEGE